MGNPKDPTAAEPLLDKLFLVNLEMDISEGENLIEKFPEEAERLKNLHDTWLKEVREEMNK